MKITHPIKLDKNLKEKIFKHKKMRVFRYKNDIGKKHKEIILQI